MSGFRNGRSKEDCESRSPNSSRIPIASRIMAFLRPDVFPPGRIGLAVDTLIVVPVPCRIIHRKEPGLSVHYKPDVQSPEARLPSGIAFMVEIAYPGVDACGRNDCSGQSSQRGFDFRQ